MRNYEMFMRDYIKEDNPEFYEKLPPYEEIEEFDEGGKEGVYKENFYLRDHLQIPTIRPILQSRKNRDSIVDFVGTYIDEHFKQLTTSGPVFKVTFTAKETSFLYELFKITPERIFELYNEMVNETYGGKISKFYVGWVKNAPHKILLIAMIAESVEFGYDDIIECCEYMLAFTDYPIVYDKYWKIGVNEEIMNYTIEHLGAKYKIRELGLKTLQELLKYDATTTIEFYRNKLNPCPDNLYNDIIYRLRNQINSKLKNISRQYFANVENNASQHSNVIQFDDGEIAEHEGHASIMASLIDKTINKFGSGDINKSMISIVANRNKTDKSNVEGMIGQIITTKNNRINKFIEDVITYYFEKYPNTDTISSAEFLNFGLGIYKSMGTSKNEFLSDLKNILDFWMNNIIKIQDMYNRAATIIDYRKSIFDYMILMINYYN